MLVQSKLIELLIGLYGAGGGSSGLPRVRTHPVLGHSIRQCLLHLASLQGGVFPAQQPMVQTQFLARMIRGSSQTMCCPLSLSHVASVLVAGTMTILNHPVGGHTAGNVTWQKGADVLAVGDEMRAFCDLLDRLIHTFDLQQFLSLGALPHAGALSA